MLSHRLKPEKWQRLVAMSKRLPSRGRFARTLAPLLGNSRTLATSSVTARRDKLMLGLQQCAAKLAHEEKNWPLRWGRCAPW